MIETIKKHLEKNYPFLPEEIKENLIAKSINSLKKELSILEEVLKTDEKEIILKQSHKIKGTLLNTGFEKIAKEFEEFHLRDLPLEKIKEKLKDSINRLFNLLP